MLKIQPENNIQTGSKSYYAALVKGMFDAMIVEELLRYWHIHIQKEKEDGHFPLTQKDLSQHLEKF